VREYSAGLPERRLALGLLWRGAYLWALARGAMLALDFASRGALPPSLFPAVTPSAAVGVTLAVGVLGLLESRRVNEHRFLANLGVSPAAVALLVMLPAIGGEMLSAVRHLP